MTSPTALVNRGARAVALAGRIGLKGYDRPATATQSPAAAPPEAAPTDRATAIMALPEARARPSEARHLANKTAMSVNEAQAYLAAGRTGGPAATRPVAAIAAPAVTLVDRGARTKALAAKVGLRGHGNG